MIVGLYNNEDDYIFTTNGCGCCSNTLFLSSDKEEIIKELKENIEIVRISCDQIGINFDDLL